MSDQEIDKVYELTGQMGRYQAMVRVLGKVRADKVLFEESKTKLSKTFEEARIHNQARTDAVEAQRTSDTLEVLKAVNPNTPQSPENDQQN